MNQKGDDGYSQFADLSKEDYARLFKETLAKIYDNIELLEAIVEDLLSDQRK